MAPPSELLCRSSNRNTAGLAKISGNNKHCVVVKSITRKPLLLLQTLSQQHVCSRRGFPRLKLRELSGLAHSAQCVLGLRMNCFGVLARVPRKSIVSASDSFFNQPYPSQWVRPVQAQEGGAFMTYADDFTI